MGLLTYEVAYWEGTDLYTHQNYVVNGRLMEITYPLWHYVVAFLYLGLHMGIEKASALACVLFAVAFMFVIWSYLYCTLKKDYKTYQIDFFAFILGLVQPLYLGILFRGLNIGRSLTNPLSNPTQIAVRPMALIVTLLTVLLWDVGRDEYFSVRGKRIGKKVCFRILIAIFLLLSVLAKPSFAQVYYLAFALVVIGRFIKARGKNFRECFWDGVSLVPSMIQFIVIYYMYFGNPSGEQSEPLGFVFLGVWSYFTDSIPLSILAALAFAIAVLIFLGKRVCNYKGVLFSWLMTIIGILEYMFIMETGGRQYHGNFSWGYQIGCSLLWVFSLQAFLKERRSGLLESKKKYVELLIWLLLACHLLAGIYDYALDFIL